ncbi:WD40 repeat-like protein [Laetiporus sulphureus 93-53]|uniref:WD40 repeat-like protein n=1 Tax=Laetiporus sulphureus 93-53 TaxID=1314785 RepID=A0A165DRZ1_9APHY|nr:WD40 repeat-like protein [Laetiporus sulphureus 93-53]KZT05508.1 WD40 repeat-like protein [Laetiporus sulphureus 93-53]
MALLSSSIPSSSISRRWKARLLSASLEQPLDRVNVLGDETSGHTGCVNALSWARDGELLLSGGDDKTVRLWRMDASDHDKDYPFVCQAVVHTGHRANIFNAQMLPHSSRIASVAGDSQVRVFDVSTALSSRHDGEMELTTRAAQARVLQCHSARVKRIVTEESPDLFLTVAEDGTVRQHDLRVPHNCFSGSCPSPLIKLSCSLNTLALSPLTPYQFVVAGEAPYGYLYDRRAVGRFFQEEWGMPPDADSLTTCVRRFGRKMRGPNERKGDEHITGARMATSNGHEVSIPYSSDVVYLYSTLDDPQSSSSSTRASSVLPPAPPPRIPPRTFEAAARSLTEAQRETDRAMEEDIERMMEEDAEMFDGEELFPTDPDDENAENEERGEEEQASTLLPTLPIVLPRARFVGAGNVETIKDVNFLGPRDEFVASGSDDGNFFIWRKSTGKLHDILEGDGSVVNVIEGHPHLPLLAVSGIDTTVKLFAPARGGRAFSKLGNAENIIKRNSEASSRTVDLASLFIQYQLLAGQSAVSREGTTPQCTFQ